MPRVRQVVNVQADKIGLTKKAIAVDKLGVQLLFHVRRRPYRIAVKHSHLEALRTPRHTAANSTKTDNAKRLAPNMSTEQLIEVPSRPVSRPHLFIAFEQTPGDCHQERPGKIRGRIVEYTGCICGDHFVLRTGSHVDVVEAARDSRGNDTIRYEKFVVQVFRNQLQSAYPRCREPQETIRASTGFLAYSLATSFETAT